MKLQEAIEAQQTKARRRAGLCDDKDLEILRWLEELKARRGAVDHPSHFTACSGPVDADGQPTYEVIKVIERLGLARGFCLGGAVKYLLRARHKGAELQDLLKARWYLRRWGKDEGTNRYANVDVAAISRAWSLSTHLAAALAHLRGGWVSNTISFVEAELDDRFPGWREEC